jgi:hypothetical protein
MFIQTNNCVVRVREQMPMKDEFFFCLFPLNRLSRMFTSVANRVSHSDGFFAIVFIKCDVH